MWDTQMGWAPWAERIHTILQRSAYVLKEKLNLDVSKDAA